MPVVGRRRVKTTVRVHDGETLAIGGLLQELEVQSHSRIPVLGSLPILGRLFSNERTTTEETEVIILITPRIMRDATPAAAPGSAVVDADAGRRE